MSSYYANVTFPSTALTLPALRQLYRSIPILYVLEQDMTVTIADPEAEFGKMAITDLLDALQVPYDHFHRNEAGRNVYTQQVRFIGGERIMKVIRDADELIKRYAQDLLDLINAGDIDQVREQLEYTVSKSSGVDIAAVSVHWDPDQLYVLFNAEESRENDGAGYWSDNLGWAGIHHANIFDAVQRAVYEADENSTWQTLADALAGFKLAQA